MKRSRRLQVIFCLSVFAGIVPGVLTAQSNPAAAPSTSFRGTSGSQTTPAADEVTMAGTIEQVVASNTPGRPRGLQLVLAGPQGMINASLGPYLSTDVKESLAAGQHLEVTGVTHTWNGQSYFLVRDFTLGGHHVTVRNEKGFLIHPQKPGITRTRQSQTVTKGENQ
jgi:hypothetical protein